VWGGCVGACVRVRVRVLGRVSRGAGCWEGSRGGWGGGTCEEGEAPGAVCVYVCWGGYPGGGQVLVTC
jgi:hypothetical protein